MGVVYLAYCGSWQLSLHESCFCAFYIFNTTPNPTSSSFFQNVFVLVLLQRERFSITLQYMYNNNVIGMETPPSYNRELGQVYLHLHTCYRYLNFRNSYWICVPKLLWNNLAKVSFLCI